MKEKFLAINIRIQHARIEEKIIELVKYNE
jgi:hypothetical protein